ncbi:unnamed protein product, partial [Effrenium voratum]
MADLIQVEVISLSGRCLRLEAQPDRKLGHVKQLVSHAWEVPSLCLQLSLGTRVLSDEELIGHCLEGNAVNLSAVVHSEHIYEAIDHGGLLERAKALAALPHVAQPGDGRAVDAALAALRTPLLDVQLAALDALVLLGKSNTNVIEDLVCLVDSWWCSRGDTFVKCYAMKSLARIAPQGNERAMDALLACLVDPEKSVREQVRKEVLPVLVHTGDPIFISLLVSQLRKPDRQVRQAALEALPAAAGEQGADRAILQSAQLLDHNDWVVRQCALKAIASLAEPGHPNATALAISCLQDRDRDIRCEALEMLPRVAPKGDMQAMLSMAACLEDKEQDVREATLRNLPLLADPDAGDCDLLLDAIKKHLVHSDERWRHSAVILLPRLTPSGQRHCSMQMLMPLLKDKQAWIRCSAVEAIADLADQSSEAFDALAGCLADAEAAVRWAAMKGLATMDPDMNENARRTLERRLDDGCCDDIWKDALEQIQEGQTARCA